MNKLLRFGEDALDLKELAPSGHASPDQEELRIL